jgi:hypothetical protein
MPHKEFIYCRTCKKQCGIYHPATGPSWSYPGDPAYGEGVGEDFVGHEGEWHCSQKCLRETEELRAELIAQDLDLFPNAAGLWVPEDQLEEELK